MINGVKLKNVSHFYAPETWEENRATQIWLKCFSKYSGVFDECTVIVASDCFDDEEFNKKVFSAIVSHCYCKNIQIKAEHNTAYRESKTFYDEIIQKKFDGITFFNHTKGTTNYGKYDTQSIDDWIIGLWYLSFLDIESMVNNLSYNGKNGIGNFFYGAFPIINPDYSISKDMAFNGSFYWVNMNLIRSEIGNNIKGEIPILSSRLYAEKFPGLILSKWLGDSWDGRYMTTSFSGYKFYPVDLYKDDAAYDCICEMSKKCGRKILNEFNELKAYVLNEQDSNNNL